MYKLLIVVALIGVVRSLDLNLGTKELGRKVFDEDVTAKPALWKRTKTLTVTADEGEIISGIFVTDLRPKKDGVVEILEGGEKQKNVVLKLKSPAVFRGYYFHVTVYAQPAFQPRLVPTIIKDVSAKKEPKTTTTTEATSTTTLSSNNVKHVTSETTTKAIIPTSEEVPVTEENVTEVEIVQTTEQNSIPLVPVEVTSVSTEVEAVPTKEEVPIPRVLVEVTSENSAAEENVPTTEQNPVPIVPIEVTSENSAAEENVPTAELVPVPTVLVEVTSETSAAEENVPTTEQVAVPILPVEVTSENSAAEDTLPTTEQVAVPILPVEVTSENSAAEDILPATEQNLVVPVEVANENSTTVRTPLSEVTSESVTEIELVPTTEQASDTEILQVETRELPLPVASIDGPNEIATDSNNATCCDSVDQSATQVAEFLR